MSQYTTESIISYAEISQYLSNNDIAALALFPGTQLVPSLCRRLYMVRKGVQWAYGVDSADTTLEATGNYLYALCGKYALRAQYILNNSTGGIVINPVTGLPINLQRKEVQFVVGATLSPMNAGDTVYILNDTPIHGWLSLYADGTKLPIDESVRFSYSVLYNTTNTIITFNQALYNGQEIDIVYWKAGSAAVTPTGSNYIVTQTYFTATADDTTVTTPIAALTGATIIAITKAITPLDNTQWSFNSGTNEITLLGGLSMIAGETLYIIYSVTT